MTARVQPTIYKLRVHRPYLLLFFVSSISVTTTLGDWTIIPDCPFGEYPFKFSEMLFECYPPFVQGPCSDSEWLRLDYTNELSCEINPCGDVDKVIFNGSCTPLYSNDSCEDRERLYINSSGYGYCDCLDGFFRHTDGFCYQVFTVGFCNKKGEILLPPKLPGPTSPDSNCVALLDRHSERVKDCVFPFKHDGNWHMGCSSLLPQNPELRYCGTSQNFLGADSEIGLCSDECSPKIGLWETAADFKLECGPNPCLRPNSLPHFETYSEGGTFLNCHSINEGITIQDSINCLALDLADRKLNCRTNAFILRSFVSKRTREHCPPSKYYNPYRRRCQKRFQ